MADLGGSTTPPITVPIQSHVINAKEISDEIFKAFQAGLNEVMKSKKFAVHMRNVFRMMGAEMEKSMAKSGKAMADQITKSLTGAAKSGSQAFNHLVPNSVQQAVDRLIHNFDRLDKVIAGLGRPSASMEHTLAQINKSIARSTTEAARQQTAAQNTAMQQQAANANAAAKKRVAIIQFMAGQIRALERGLGSVVKFAAEMGVRAVRLLGTAWQRMGASARAGARAAAAAMRSVATAVANVVRGVARMSAGLATGFARGFAGISRSLVGALRRDEGHLRSSLSRRERMVSASASKQGSLLSRITSGQAVAGLAGGAGLGSILSGGFTRFANIERLQFQFERLLGSETAASAMLERISEFSRTTSFDLTGIAGLATNFVAIGQSADQSMESIERLADVTAFAGGNTESLERIQRALGQIVSTGRLQGDELNQLAENLPGINIRKIIADQMGVSTAELVKMQEAGELDAEAFINAFLTGIDDPRFNGAAQEIAKTLSGRLANLKETFDIFGASLVGLVADPLREGMEEVTSILTKVGDFVSGEMFKPKAGTVNPFKDLSDDTMIMFEDLPEEFQRQLEALGEGWKPGMWVDARGAEEWWNNNNPPEAEEAISNLEKFRDILGDFAKGAGGFLAFAGGFKLFAAALRFLISPLTIVTALFGALNVMWSRMKSASFPLRNALDSLGQRFSFLKERLEDTLGIVLGLLSTAMFGDSDFFKNMGDKMAEFVGWIGRGVGSFSHWLEGINKLLEAREFGKVIDSVSQSLQGFLSNMLGLTDAQLDAAQAFGGNDFGNIFTAFLDKLENVPVLGPIVSFVRRIVDTIANVVRRFAGFIRGVWDDLFGGGEGREGLMGGVENAMFGNEAKESTATRLLNRLEDTFLGPVVRFFRGPFADAVENVGEFIGGLFNALFNPAEEDEDDAIITRVADFLSEHGLKGLVDWLRGDALSTAWTNVTTFFAPAIKAVTGAIQTAYDVLSQIAEPIVGWVQDLITAFGDEGLASLDLGNIALGAGVGLLAGSLLGGPIGGIAGAGIGAAFGAGLGTALADSIGVAWDMISPAISGLWSKISQKIHELFSADNIKGAGTFLLDLVYKAGEAVGNIAGDPRFVGAVFGLIGAGAAIIGNLTIGIAAGIENNKGEWATLISDGLKTAWETLLPDFIFIPDPLSTAIKGAIEAIGSDAAISTAIGLLGIGLASKIFTEIRASLAGKRAAKIAAGGRPGSFTFSSLGTSIATGMMSSISRAFSALWQGGAALFAGKMTGKGKLGIGKGNIFESRGQAFGASLASGIAIGMVGYAAGKEGGAYSILGAILGGAAAGASIGSVISPGWGTAIGAALGAGIAGVGAFFGNAKRQAEEAKVAVDEFTQAILNSGEAGAQQVVTSRFLEIDDEGVRTLLSELGGFDVPTFTDRLFEGVTTSGDEAARIIDNIHAQLSAAAAEGKPVTAAQLEAFTQMSDFARGMGEDFDMETFRDGLNEAGIEIDDVIEGMWHLGSTSGFLFDGLKEVDGITDSLVGGLGAAGEAAVITSTSFTDVADAAGEIVTALAGGSTADELVALIEARGAGLDATEKLEAIKAAADEIQASAEAAKDALVELISGGAAPVTIEDVINDVNLDIFNLRDQLEGLKPAEGETVLSLGEVTRLELETDAAIADFTQGLRDDLAEAVDKGAITSQADWDAAMAAIKAQLAAAVAEGFITPAQSEEIIAGLSNPEWIAAVTDGIADMVALYDQNTTLETAAESLMGRVMAVFKVNPADYVPGINSQGGGIMGNLLTSFTRARTPAAPAEDGAAGGAGGAGVTQYATSFSAGKMQIQTAIKTTVSEAFGGAAPGLTIAAIAAGVKTAAQFASGVKTGASQARSAGAQAAAQASSGATAASILMFAAGLNAGNAFARGIAAARAAAAIAAASIAYAAASSAKYALRISSPSKVFVDIGQQIGEGFVQGIEESEGNMTNALTGAIDKALTEATDTAQARSAKAGAAIFNALIPSTMPGGTPTSTTSLSRLQQWIETHDFGASLRSDRSGLFSDRTAGAWHTASNEINNASINFQQSITDLRKEWEDAWHQAFDPLEAGETRTPLSFRQQNILNTGPAALGPGSFAGIANTETLDAAISSIKQWGNMALEAGAGTDYVVSVLKQYTQGIRDLAVAYGLNAGTVDSIIAQYQMSSAALDEWGRSLTQLNTGSVQGIRNIIAMLEQLEQVREVGVGFIEAGFSIADSVAVIRTMRDELISQGLAYGYSIGEINSLVEQVGLSNTALAEFTKQMKDFEGQADSAAAAAAKLKAEEDAAASSPLGRPVVENLNVYIPYGDPEATGMAVANRLAYQGVTSW